MIVLTMQENGDVVVDMARREVRVNDEPIALATREFDLLAFLVQFLVASFFAGDRGGRGDRGA